MVKGRLFILLVIYINNSSCVIDDIYNIGIEVNKWYTIIDEIRLKNTPDARELGELIDGDDMTNAIIKNQMDRIHMQLDRVDKLMNHKVFTTSLSSLISSEILLLKDITEVELLLLAIDESYDAFWRYVNDRKYHSDEELQRLTRNLMVDIEGSITHLRRLVTRGNEFQPDHENLVDAISRRAVLLESQICNSFQVFPSILVNLCRAIMIAEMKVNIMSTFENVYMYSNNEGWKTLILIAVETLERKFANYLHIFTKNVGITQLLYLRPCDPIDGTWTRNKNFYELEGTIQTTIFRYRWGLCKYASCNDIMFLNPNRCEPTLYDRRSSCSSSFSECAWLNTITACVLRNGPYKFQFVNSTELGSMGRNFKCPQNNGYIIEDGRGWNLSHAACACNCYGSHNKISLAIAQSQVTSNKVVTGLRFFRQSRILFIQVKQGRLDTNGYIIRRSEAWVSIKRNLDSSEIHSIDKTNRVFFLEDLQLPPHYLLTGVKFNAVIRSNISGFAIGIYGVKFDYKSGRLEPKNTIQMSDPYFYQSGKRVLFKAINSARARYPHVPNAENFRYVKLERSELPDDFGQATLPFFDTIEVITRPPSVLGGVGIFHKGTDDYAGFISLRVFGIEYEHYFSDFIRQHVVDNRVSFNNSGHNNL